MWTTTVKCKHGIYCDKIVEITHGFDNNVTVVTDLEANIIKTKHGEITVDEIDLIRDIEEYTKFLNNINNKMINLRLIENGADVEY